MGSCLVWFRIPHFHSMQGARWICLSQARCLDRSRRFLAGFEAPRTLRFARFCILCSTRLKGKYGSHR
jgi:hypothetical protein